MRKPISIGRLLFAFAMAIIGLVLIFISKSTSHQIFAGIIMIIWGLLSLLPKHAKPKMRIEE